MSVAIDYLGTQVPYLNQLDLATISRPAIPLNFNLRRLLAKHEAST